VIINVAFAQRLQMSPREAVGSTLRVGPDGPVAHIVGVVQNAETVRPGEGHRPFLYETLRQDGGGDIALHVEATLDGAAVAPTVPTILRELDPNLPDWVPRLRVHRARSLEALAPRGVDRSRPRVARGMSWTRPS
jgi:hypothetical protein